LKALCISEFDPVVVSDKQARKLRVRRDMEIESVTTCQVALGRRQPNGLRVLLQLKNEKKDTGDYA
jgi:hypothetical protein